jgi:hypothetical protein
MKIHSDAKHCLQTIVISLYPTLHRLGIVPAKSGQEDSSNENETNESRGTPASFGGDSEMRIGCCLGEGNQAASALLRATSVQRKRLQVDLGNILID